MKHFSLQKNSPLIWVLVVLSFVAVVTTVFLIMFRVSADKNVNDFQSCKDAGGTILESYPEQCMLNGKSFVNTSQVTGSNGYVGLTEQAALSKAKTAGVPARVVERDGESLPVTMDYAVGRLNFYVQNGYVYRVVVEGEEQTR